MSCFAAQFYEPCKFEIHKVDAAPAQRYSESISGNRNVIIILHLCTSVWRNSMPAMARSFGSEAAVWLMNRNSSTVMAPTVIHH